MDVIISSVELRECWNWQTGTFEVRVPLAYGFKSRLAHQKKIIRTESSLQKMGPGDFLFFKELKDARFRNNAVKGPESRVCFKTGEMLDF